VREFTLGSDGILRFQGRVCVPDDVEVKKFILEEWHKIRLSMHPGMTKCTKISRNLLVAGNKERCCTVCSSLFDVSKGEG